MSTLRITLLIIGALLIVAVYFYSKRSARGTDAASGRTGKRDEPVWDEQQRLASNSTEQEIPDIDLSLLTDLVREAAKETSKQQQPVASSNKNPIRTEPVRSENESTSSLLLNGDILVLHVLSRAEEGFQGENLMQVLDGQNIRFGKMQIFHYADPESQEELFSVVNIMKPGHFELSKIQTLTTPGISFIMQLERIQNPSKSYEMMLRVVSDVAEALDARVCDVKHGSLTAQSATFLHEEIKLYQHNHQRG